MAATIPLFWRSRTKALECRLQRETLFLRDLARQYDARQDLDSVSLLSGRLYACTEGPSPLFRCLPAVAYESCFREPLLLRMTAFATNGRCRTSLHRKQRDVSYRRHRSVQGVDRRNSIGSYCACFVSYDEFIDCQYCLRALLPNLWYIKPWYT